MIRFTQDHEWVRQDKDGFVVGITSHAQEQLGDVVFVEVPDVGKVLVSGKEAAVVESVKAASEVYAPLNGTVVESNRVIVEDPSIVNKDPTGEGWFFRLSGVDISAFEKLMTEEQYRAYVETLS